MNHSSTSSISRFIPLLAMLCLSLLATGCMFKGDAYNAAARENLDKSWRPTPVAIRVYPSSRFTMIEQQLVVEARVELLDEMGDPTKSSGQFHFQLQTTGLVSGSEEVQHLYSWDMNLLTLQDQQVAYDPITQAYLFRLKCDHKQMPAVPTTLLITLIQPSGQRLDAKATLPVMR